MGAAILLRDDFSSTDLHHFAKASKDADQTRRLLALAAIYDGARRGEAAGIGGVGRQIIRDWVVRFNGHGPQGLIDGKAKSKPRKLNDAQRQALADIVESGPIPAIHDVVRWRLIDLKQWIWDGLIYRVGDFLQDPNHKLGMLNTNLSLAARQEILTTNNDGYYPLLGTSELWNMTYPVYTLKNVDLLISLFV